MPNNDPKNPTSANTSDSTAQNLAAPKASDLTRYTMSDDDEAGKTVIDLEANSAELAATVIGAAPPLPSAKLVLLEGAKSGPEHVLTGDEITLGRDQGNGIRLIHKSVSRKHAALRRRTGGGFTFHDLGSGNGSFVNGERVKSRDLANGDELRIGDVSLRFLDSAGQTAGTDPTAQLHPETARAQNEPTRARPSPLPTKTKPAPVAPGIRGWPAAKKRRYALWTLAVLIFFLLGLGREYKRRVAARDAAAAEEAREQSTIDEAMTAAKEAIKRGDWSAAREKIAAAKAVAPEDPELTRYTEIAEKEAPRADAVQRALAKIAAHDWDGARTLLAQVPAESAVAEQAQEAKKKLETAVAEASKAAEAKPAAAQQQTAPPPAPAQPEAQHTRGKHVKNKKQKTSAATGSQALAPYLAGDFATALAKAQAAGDATMVTNLNAFQAAMRDAATSAHAGRNAEAVQNLEAAERLDRLIAPAGGSRPGNDVRHQLADLHYGLGTRAKTDGHLAQAATHFRAAMAADAGHVLAAQEMQKLQREAHDLYLRAYIAADTDPETARGMLHTVLQVTPAGGDDAKKAKKLLDKLDRKDPAPGE